MKARSSLQLVCRLALGSSDDIPWDTEGYKDPTPAEDFIEGIAFDCRQPNAYIEAIQIGLKGSQTIIGNEIQQ